MEMQKTTQTVPQKAVVRVNFTDWQNLLTTISFCCLLVRPQFLGGDGNGGYGLLGMCVGPLTSPAFVNFSDCLSEFFLSEILLNKICRSANFCE